MVTAVTANATKAGVYVYDSGRFIAAKRGDLADASDPHGINRDEADELLESLGWESQHWVWHRDGYYKSVVVPRGSRPVKPFYAEDEHEAWLRTPEGRRHAEALARLRARQGR